jgi:WD40 repeat protein
LFGRIARSADGRTIAMIRGGDVLLGRLKPDGSPGPFIQPRGLNPRSEAAESPEVGGADRPHGPPQGAPPPSPDSPPPGGRNGRGGDMAGRNAWRDLALSPDGRLLFLLTPEEISVWAVDEDRVARLPWSSPEQPVRMALAPGGRELAVLDFPGALMLVDAGDGHIIRLLEAAEEGGGPGSLAFSPDGRELAIGSRDQIRIWSLAGPVPRLLFRLPGDHEPITALTYDPRGRYLASGGVVTGAVRVWDLDLVRDKLAGLGLD